MEPIEIRALEPELQDDYLAFFDRDAFADNPEWASCYCCFNQAGHDLEEWNQRCSAQNRAGAARGIEQGWLRGYLAYSGGKVIGWCNANLRSRYTVLDLDQLPEEPVGAITCFVIAKPYRRQGVARRLLAAACEGFRRQGLSHVEAYPRRDPGTEATEYHGHLAMYLAAGFEKVRQTDRMVVMRKLL